MFKKKEVLGKGNNDIPARYVKKGGVLKGMLFINAGWKFCLDLIRVGCLNFWKNCCLILMLMLIFHCLFHLFLDTHLEESVL
mgnify:CR=1 FL=1